MLYFAISLIPIAFIYIGFAYYYGVMDAVHAELVGVILFSVLALLAIQLNAKLLIYAYIAHAMWDVLHEVYMYGFSAIPWTQVPMGYAVFCLAYDLIIAGYVWQRSPFWQRDRSA
jgi:hypothetical protein